MTYVGLQWEELLMPLLQKYKLNITWGDQDLLNIIFHHNPGMAVQRHQPFWDFTIHRCVHPQPVLAFTPIIVMSNSVYILHLFPVPREPAGVSLQVELSSRSLHLRQQLRIS